MDKFGVTASGKHMEPTPGIGGELNLAPGCCDELMGPRFLSLRAADFVRCNAAVENDVSTVLVLLRSKHLPRSKRI